MFYMHQKCRLGVPLRYTAMLLIQAQEFGQRFPTLIYVVLKQTLSWYKLPDVLVMFEKVLLTLFVIIIITITETN